MRIIIGAANFSSKYGINNSKLPSISEIKKILTYCKKKKINIIDDAISYKNSSTVFKKIDTKKFKFISKIRLPKNYKSIKNLKLYFLDQIKDSLKKTGQNKYSCLLAHEIYQNKKKNIILFDILNFLKKNKLTDKIGISVYSPKEISWILDFWKPDIIQSPLNIFDQRLASNGLIDNLTKKGIEIQVRSIFLQGILLSNKPPIKLKEYNNDFKKWNKWCNLNKLSKVEACIHFIKKFNKIAAFIVGINNLKQLKEIVKHAKKKIIDINYKPILRKKRIIDPRKW